jgi:hypothetical protein
MADMMSILSSAYKAVGSAGVRSNTKYVPVDPKLYQGTWTGTYANKKTFKITVSDVTGFRAQVKYESAGTVKYQSVLIKDMSFRIGDTKLMLSAKSGTAQVKNVVTDPATGSTYLDTAVATLSS